MRPYRAATLVLSLGAIVFSAAPSIAQEQPETTRKIITKVIPVYPELANKMQIRGTVRVEAVVAPNGKVKFTQVIGGRSRVGKSRRGCHRKMEMGTSSAGNQRTHRT
jgi:hypothetical protein